MNDDPPVQEIVIRDIRMRFGSMVVFMVKWALASIPALLILISLGVFFAISLRIGAGVLLGSFFPRSLSETSAGGNAEGMTEEGYIPQVKIRNVQVSNANHVPSVSGEIKNTGQHSLGWVEITVHCLGPGQSVVFEKLATPIMPQVKETPPLKPGDGRSFNVELDGAPVGWNGSVEVKVTRLGFE